MCSLKKYDIYFYHCNSYIFTEVCEGKVFAGVCLTIGGHAWQGPFMARGGMHDRGHAWQGVCIVVGGWACMSGETATEVGGKHPTGMHSCRRWF